MRLLFRKPARDFLRHYQLDKVKRISLDDGNYEYLKS